MGYVYFEYYCTIYNVVYSSLNFGIDLVRPEKSRVCFQRHINLKKIITIYWNIKVVISYELPSDSAKQIENIYTY